MAIDAELYELLDPADREVVDAIAKRNPTWETKVNTGAKVVRDLGGVGAFEGEDSTRDILAALDTKLSAFRDDFKKDVVTKTDLETMLNEKANALLTQSLKTNYEIGTIREEHRREFGEDLPATDLDKFMADKRAAGFNYPSIGAAYNDFIQPKKTERMVEQRAAEKANEKIKQLREAGDLPGTTPPASSSPVSVFMTRDAERKQATGGRGSGRLSAAIAELHAKKAAAAA